MLKAGDEVIIINDLDLYSTKGSKGVIVTSDHTSVPYYVMTDNIGHGWFREKEIVLNTKINRILYGVDNG